jgi:hypothetical protein
MKVIIAVVLLCLLFSVTVAEKSGSRCVCPSTYSPVCSVNGRSYANSCFAKCFNDPIKTKGNCPEKQLKKKECKLLSFGKNGQRKHCCSWIQQGNLQLNKSCKWTGKPKYKYMVNRCSWKAKSKGVHQRYCCSWVRTKKGSKVVDQPKKCQFVGKEIRKSVKKGCLYKRYGKFGKRKYCCSNKTVCKNKTHCSKKLFCGYKGKIHFSKVISACKWIQQGNTKRRQCCSYLFKYTHPFNKATSKKTILKCKFVGTTVLKVAKKNCTMRVYGKNSKRRKCCQWQKVCNHSTCYMKNVNCRWVGCVKTKKVSRRCEKKNNGTVCCNIQKTCSCNKCKVTRRSCHLKKKPAKRVFAPKKKVHTTCQWKLFNKNLKRRMCCTYEKTCTGKTCTPKKLVSCRFVGDVILNPVLKCSWKQLSPQHFRKYCCSKKCSKCKEVCEYKGSVVIKTPKKSCQVRKYFAKNAKRQRCCTWSNVCVGKKKCVPVNVHCKWTGKVTRRMSQKECKWTKKGLNGKIQIQCCRWTNVCVGKSCKAEKKKCNFVGKKLSVTQGVDCKLRKIGKNSLRNQCCSHKKICSGKSCTFKKLKCVNKGPLITFKYSNKCKKSKGLKLCSTLVRKCSNNKCKIENKTHTIYKKSCKSLKSGKKRCCRSVRRCVNGKCGKNLEKCSVSSSYFKQVGGEKCKFKAYKNGKKQHCCRTVESCSPNASATSCNKQIQCRWVGKTVTIGKKYYRKKVKCERNGNKKICCTDKLKCGRFGCVSVSSSCHVKTEKTTRTIPHLKCVIKKGLNVVSFKKSKFTHTFEGVWMLFSSKSLKVAIKNKKVGKVIKPVGFSIKSGKSTLEVLSSSYLLLNQKKIVSIPHNFGKSVHISKKENTLMVNFGRRGSMIVKFGKNSIQKIVVLLPKTLEQSGTSGLCSSEETLKKADGLFTTNSNCTPATVNQFVNACHKNIACVLRRC